MNIKHILLPTVALGGAALLLIPAKTDAYNFLGGSLNTTQRDFRIFDNFTDPTANDNVTADANFPGYTGCELAIWKACTEWGSQLHAGNGNGDPHQPGGLGSGGANFDAVMQGNATEVGGQNKNTFSEITGSDGGTLAYCESPISDGWRIRFYQVWTWNDGPGTAIGTNEDIQGVATHEYGHALGLDHSGQFGATMWPSVTGSGVNGRSIHQDDIDGVQALYGVAAAEKPRILGISSSGGLLTIHGVNFDDTLTNDVWFTPNTPGGEDVPIQVNGLASDGAILTMSIPAGAGSGEVFVKIPTSNQGSTLSNGWPIDLGNLPDPPGSAYCFGDGSLPTPCPCALPDTVPSPSGASDSGCANSFDLDGASLSAVGGLSPDTLKLTCVIGGNTAAYSLILKGNGSDPNGVANGDGVRCVDGALIRFGAHNAGTNGAPLGTWTYPNSAQTTSISAATAQPGGETAYYQLFYRNNAVGFCNPATTNMSNGYQVAWP